MGALIIAQLKDNIINYLNDSAKKHHILELIYPTLMIENISMEVIKGYVEEMAQDEVITSTLMSGNRTILTLTNIGRKLLSEGGYVKRLKDELDRIKLLESDPQRYKEKTDLEIKNLKASIADYERVKKIDNLKLKIFVLGLIVSVMGNIIQIFNK